VLFAVEFLTLSSFDLIWKKANEFLSCFQIMFAHFVFGLAKNTRGRKKDKTAGAAKLNRFTDTHENPHNGKRTGAWMIKLFTIAIIFFTIVSCHVQFSCMRYEIFTAAVSFRAIYNQLGIVFVTAKHFHLSKTGTYPSGAPCVTSKSGVT
jgi:hypothetical protein